MPVLGVNGSFKFGKFGFRVFGNTRTPLMAEKASTCRETGLGPFKLGQELVFAHNDATNHDRHPPVHRAAPDPGQGNKLLL